MIFDGYYAGDIRIDEKFYWEEGMHKGYVGTLFEKDDRNIKYVKNRKLTDRYESFINLAMPEEGQDRVFMEMRFAPFTDEIAMKIKECLAKGEFYYFDNLNDILPEEYKDAYI
jgi:hypothetical protein